MKLPLVVAVDLPLRTESRNANGHWRTHASKAKEHRSGACMAMGTPLRRAGFTNIHHVSMGPEYPVLVCPLIVRMTRLSRGELDDDNLRGALKAIRDGIADALGINDRDPRVEWRYAQAKASKEMPYAVRIEVWERALEQERPRAGTDG